MAESRHLWIDDASDEYDSSEEELATQPCSVSPMRRESISEIPRSDAAFVVDCLLKQIELMQPPYQFLLIGIPFKLNNAKKLHKAVFGDSSTTDVELKVLYKGKMFSGKAIMKTGSKETARSLTQVHGRKVGNRELAVEVFRELQQKPAPAHRPVSLKIAAQPVTNKTHSPQNTVDASGKIEEVKLEFKEDSSLTEETSPSEATRSRAVRFRARKCLHPS